MGGDNSRIIELPLDLAVAMNAMASTNSAVLTIHSRKSPRRQFIVQPASQRQTRRRLATMRTGANYSLWMVGRWRANLRAEYILSEAGGRGRRRCGVGREEDSNQRCQDRCPIGRCQNGRRVTPSPRGCQQHDFLFPKFFPKKFGQKIGAGPPMEDFGNGTCAGPVLLHPAPLSGR